MFLVDGSGSVTDDDFKAMTDLLDESANQLLEKDNENIDARVGIIQFSNEVSSLFK